MTMFYSREFENIKHSRFQSIAKVFETCRVRIQNQKWKISTPVCRQKVKITEFDRQEFKIKATAYGEEFTIGKHTQGAEVKAITYSAMQINECPQVDRPEVFVIVDIWCYPRPPIPMHAYPNDILLYNCLTTL